jgi:HPr kinase/phosphorylase
MRQVSVDRLFLDNREKLGLTWRAGKQGSSRVLTGEMALKPTVGQIGHMNFIHPFRLQILGPAEINYLTSLSESELRSSIDRLFTTELAAVIVANAETPPAYLIERCNAAHVALLTSP